MTDRLTELLDQTKGSGLTTVTLPAKHVLDWHDRCGGDFEGDGTEILFVRPRSVVVALSAAALRDLISDSRYYAECMKGEWTDGIDYASAAERVLARLRKEGLA